MAEISPLGHIVCFNISAAGHIMPTRLLCAELVKRGYKVTYVVRYSAKGSAESAEAEAKNRNMLEALGCQYVDFDDIKPIVLLPHQMGPFAVLPVMRQSSDEVIAWLGNQRPAVSGVIYDPFAAVGHLAARVLKIPSCCSISFFGAERKLAAVVDDTLRLMFEKYRVELKEMSRFYPFTYDDSFNILFSVEELLENVVDEPAMKGLHFGGAMIFDRKDATTLSFVHILGPLTEKKQSGKKIIFLSLGTLVNVIGMFQEFLVDAYNILLAAISKLENVHAILSVGPNVKLFAGQSLPSNVEIYPFVPQLEVLALSDIFISHGGNNSFNESLYYGVPLLVLPFFGDQMLIGRVVTEKKLGLALPHDAGAINLEGDKTPFPVPTRASLNIEKVFQSLKLLLDDPIFSENAKRISKKYAQKNVDSTLDALTEYFKIHYSCL